MSKQSSVDLMFNRAKSLLPMGAIDARQSLKETYQQAKAMHKEELLNIFNCGRNFQATGEGTFNEIYNEIYGKDNADNTAV